MYFVKYINAWTMTWKSITAESWEKAVGTAVHFEGHIYSAETGELLMEYPEAKAEAERLF